MEKSKEWLKQAESFCSDKFLYFNEFNNDKASKSIENQVKKMSLDLANGKLLNIYYQPVVKAINWLAYRRTIPLLQE